MSDSTWKCRKCGWNGNFYDVILDTDREKDKYCCPECRGELRKVANGKRKESGFKRSYWRHE